MSESDRGTASSGSARGAGRPDEQGSTRDTATLRQDGEGESSASDESDIETDEDGGGSGLGSPDAGSPGGMGGVGVAGGTGTDRPPGGVSPLQNSGGD